MPAKAYCERALTSITEVAMLITFKTATTVSSVQVTLYKADEVTVAGTPPISGAVGGFVNSSGTLTADTVWTVSYDDFDPSTLGLTPALYIMRFNAIPADGDNEPGKLGIRIVI